VFIEIGASTGSAPRVFKEIDVHALSTFRACIWVMLMFGMAGPAVAPDNGAQRPSARD
jgi:hypothetical protein